MNNILKRVTWHTRQRKMEKGEKNAKLNKNNGLEYH